MGILQANRIEPCDFPDRIGRGEFLKKKLLILEINFSTQHLLCIILQLIRRKCLLCPRLNSELVENGGREGDRRFRLFQVKKRMEKRKKATGRRLTVMKVKKMKRTMSRRRTKRGAAWA